MAHNYLIAGGAGFIGANLTRWLLESDSECNVVCVDIVQDPESLGAFADNERFSYEQCDIREGRGLDRIFTRHAPDRVVNVADCAEGTVEEMNAVNALGARTLALVAKEDWQEPDGSFGSNMLVQVGTCAFSRQGENDYHVTKTAGDLFALSCWHQLHLPVVIARLSAVYGPLQKDAEPDQGMLFVDDACAGIAAVFEKGKLGETYDLALGAAGADARMELAWHPSTTFEKGCEIYEHWVANQSKQEQVAMPSKKPPVEKKLFAHKGKHVKARHKKD